MGSKTSLKFPRIKKEEYENLKQLINKEYFYEFFLNNGNEEVCSHFKISLYTMGRLLSDFNIILTAEQKKNRIKIATEQAIYKKYGVKTNWERDDVKNKIKNSNLDHYGVENPFAAEEVKEKIKQTNLKRYNVEYSAQSEEIKNKSKQTCLQKYGVSNYAKTDECKEKIKNTELNKYNRANVGQFGTEEHNKAMLNKYGTLNISSLAEIQEKIKQTNLERYGVEWYPQTSEHHGSLRHIYTYNNVLFDSLPELAVYVYFTDIGEVIKRSSKKFEYFYNNELHYYFPDFEINDELIEIKGDHFFKEDGTMQNPFDHSQDAMYEAKHQCMLKNNVKIWTSSLYSKYINYLYENYNILENSIIERK